MDEKKIKQTYEMAKEQYSLLGSDVDGALEELKKFSISLHCWQGDDVGGFETPGSELSGGGIQVTGRYPGKARSLDELRSDLEKAFSLIPGRHRLNLHAIYGDFSGDRIDRDAVEARHFRSWVDWAKKNRLKIDFNATCFSHPQAESGFTLSSKDKTIREFWIEHVKRCRRISDFIGGELKNPCIHNLWIPDGSKDQPVDRWAHREHLMKSLDDIFTERFDPRRMKDSLEGKLFGIGSESFVVGSHDFYLGYALKRDKMICLDLGHFHPTESVADKLSAILQFSNELLLHFSRGVRWDSDHVVILNDEIRQVAEEIVRSQVRERVHVALDYFDGSLNRIGAWVTGARSVLKGFLIALLEPLEKLRCFEENNNQFAKMALLEELKHMPFGAIWNYYCMEMDVPLSWQLTDEVMHYETDVLRNRY